MLAKLSDLLRDLLRHRDTSLVPLGDELRYARTYLEIAQLRFADRLQFRDRCRTGAGSGIGAVVHSPAARRECARAWHWWTQRRVAASSSSARRVGDRLQLEVPDDGAGLTTSTTLREGVGLSNTRERLRASFGDDQHFSLGGGPRRRRGGSDRHSVSPARAAHAPA